MSTRSAIAMTDGENIKGIYCHFDGYPEGVGITLKQYYSDSDKVAELINLGDISTLDEFLVPVGTQHSFDTPEVGVTTAYGRDRGESGTEARYYTTLQNWLVSYDKSGCEFAYLWDTIENKWKCWDISERVTVEL